MNAEIKAKWVAALRSGKYQQGKDALRPGDNSYCCLGVLCDLIDNSKWHNRRADQDEDAVPDWRYGNGLAFAEVPSDVSQPIGLPGASQIELARMNDDGKPFAEIADYIEANL